MSKKIMIIGYAVAIIMIVASGILLSNARAKNKEADLKLAHAERQEEIWSSSNLFRRYHAMKLKLKYYDEYYEAAEEAIKILKEDLLVQKWAKLNAYEEIERMAFYINTIEEIAKLGGIDIPLFVTDIEEEENG